MLSHPSIQPLDPQFAKYTPFDFLVAIGVLPGIFEVADGYAVAVFGSATEAFGLFDHSFVLGGVT
jgi:hypothetical protein